MKIGFVLDDSLDKADGVQQYILTLGKWLGSQGHQVHYLVGHTERTDLPHVHSLSRNLQVHFNQNRMTTPLPVSKAKLRALLESEQFDVLHVQMPYSPFMAGRLVKLAPPRTAVIGTFHIIPFSGLEKIATRLLGLWLRRNLKHFDAVFSVSEPARRFALAAFKLDSRVLPNVVALHHFQGGKKLRRFQDDKLNIVFLGRLVDRKGCRHLLEAVEYLHQRHDLARVRVLIGGKGPLLDNLEAYVAQHHLKQVVQFSGFVAEVDKPDYLATADIAVFPSTGGESFGIVLIEAMAAGAGVVLAGNNVGYASVMTRADQLVNPADTPAFAKTLKHFLDNYHARRTAQVWQKQQVRQYDVREVGAQLVAAYKAAIAKKQQ